MSGVLIRTFVFRHQASQCRSSHLAYKFDITRILALAPVRVEKQKLNKVHNNILCQRTCVNVCAMVTRERNVCVQLCAGKCHSTRRTRESKQLAHTREQTLANTNIHVCSATKLVLRRMKMTARVSPKFRFCTRSLCALCVFVKPKYFEPSSCFLRLPRNILLPAL